MISIDDKPMLCRVFAMIWESKRTIDMNTNNRLIRLTRTANLPVFSFDRILVVVLLEGFVGCHLLI
jgi:Fe-S-cluster containining protein